MLQPYCVTFWDVFAAVILFNTVYATKEIEIQQWIGKNARDGPTVHVFCRLTTLNAYSHPTYRWIFSNKTLAEDLTLIEADASRYSVVYYNSGGLGSRLLIRNALKEDSGWYKCQIEHYKNGVQQTGTKGIRVRVPYYLPPLNYPTCNVRPSTTLTHGSDATFNCTVKEASPNVNLQLSLTLQRQSGNSVNLGAASVTRTVTVEDNNAMFICHMTSDTFPTASRNCSAGPVHTNRGILESIPIWGISAATGAIALILSTLSVCMILLCKKSKLNWNNTDPSSPEVTSTRMDAHSAVGHNDVDSCTPSLYPTSLVNLGVSQGDTGNIHVYADVCESDFSSAKSPNSRDENHNGLWYDYWTPVTSEDL